VSKPAKPAGKAITGLLAAVAVAAAVGAGTYYYSSKLAFIAVVNGQTLPMKDYQHRLEGVKKQYAQQMGVNFQNDAGKAVLADLQEKILAKMVETALIRSETKAQGVEPSEAEIDKEFDTILKASFGGDKAKLNERLAQLNLTEREVRDQIADGQRVQKLMDKLAGSDQVSVATAQAYYKDHPLEFQRDAEVKASHILVETLEQASSLRAQIAKGADFAELAKAHSKDPGSGAKGGDLGFFGKGQMVPEFEKAAFETPVGKVTEPVKSKFGYHIIKVEDRHNAGQQSFETMKAEIVDKLTKDRRQEAFQKWILDARKKASVTYAAGFGPKAAEGSDSAAESSDKQSQPAGKGL
jgi:parvulin-like peptidyl-prolyl isomerase